MGLGKKGIAFTFDAVFSLMIALAIIPIFLIITFNTAPQSIVQSLSIQAEDSMNVISMLRVRDIAKEQVISDLYLGGVIDDSNLNSSVLELVTDLWASNSTENNTRAQNITNYIFGRILPKSLKWSFSIYNDRVVNATENYASAATSSKRVISGYRKGAPSTGYVAGAFLTNIGGKRASAYFFFGGFVGQGVASAQLQDLPDDANITELYLELNAGANFTLYVNSEPCGFFNSTPGNFSVSNWSIASPCMSNLTTSRNNITLNFSAGNITEKYIGGGYIRLTYSTTQLVDAEQNINTYSFPGIDGIVNLYDSFYVPGNITSIDANLRFFSGENYTTRLIIGNTTVLQHSGNGSGVTVNISNASLAQMLAENNITLLDLSKKSVPLRFFMLANISGGILNGTTDVILITDTSGSMAWQLGNDNNGVVIDNCNDSDIYSTTTSRLSLAKCLDKSFVNAILGGNNSVCSQQNQIEGNRIGLVDFASSADNYISLAANITVLENEIDTYVATGATCISCAINRAYEILLEESNATRRKYIVLMTDGQPNRRSTQACYQFRGMGNNVTAGDSGVTAVLVPPWLAISSGTSDSINGVSVINRTFGKAVANSGEIYSWNSNSWSLDTDTGNTNIYSVDIFNSTLAFAVGSSAKIWRWNGATWSEMNDFGSFTFRGVSFVNRTLAFAVGDGGRIYRWNGATWSSFQVVGGGSINLFSVDAYLNISYVGGTSGKIYYWSGGTFSETTDTGGNTHYGIYAQNSTNVFVVSSNGYAYRWNGVSWFSNSLSSYALYSVHATDGIIYTTGDRRADIYAWNNTWYRTFTPIYFEGTSTAGLGCGDSDVCSVLVENSWSSMNANWSARRAMLNITNTTIDTVGLGPVGTCSFGNDTIKEIARTGNGTAYSSSNATELQTIYCQIADNILTQSTPTQQVGVVGSVQSALYPDSYITFAYEPYATDPGYSKITLGTETNRFPGCNGSFFIAPRIEIADSLRTSYSGAFWTKSMSVQDQSGQFTTVYNISDYGSSIANFGDPYRVYVPVDTIRTNATNTVRNELGLADYSSDVCSSYDRVIYKARLRASVPIGNVFPAISGGVYRIYYDIDHDGAYDGFSDITVGATLPDFDPTVRTIDQLDPENNALHDALLRLLDELNLVIVPGNSGLSGESTNPIDIKLDEIALEVVSTGEVPFAWGPLDATLEVGI